VDEATSTAVGHGNNTGSEDIEAGDDVGSGEALWRLPKYCVDRESQAEEFVATAEESREMIDAARNDLKSGRRSLLYVMVLCPSPLERCRLCLLKLCTRGNSGRAIITDIGAMVNSLIFLFDTNQDITDSIAAKKAEKGRRMRLGSTMNKTLTQLAQCINPPAQSNPVRLAGEEAFKEAENKKLIDPKKETRKESNDSKMWFYLHPNAATKNFIHLALHLQSTYIACLHVPSHELIELVPKSYQADAVKLYSMLCDDIPLEDSDESLTFVLRISQYLDSFPDSGINSDKELFAARILFHAKKALVDHPSVWEDHVGVYPNGEIDTESSNDANNFFDDNDNRIAAVNMMTFLSCGKQIGKAAKAHDPRYQKIEDFGSVVLRCSVDKLLKIGKSVASNRFLEKGTNATKAKDGTNKFDEIYNFSSGRIVAFEKDSLIAFDLNDSKEDAIRKNHTAFDDMKY